MLWKSAVVTVAALALGSAARADWTDSFDGAAFDARWHADTPNTSNGTVALDTTNHSARFSTFANTDMWTLRKDAPILWTATPDTNFCFETHVTMSTAQGGAVAGVVVYGADGAVPDFTFGLDHWSTATRMVKFQGLGDNVPIASVAATNGEAWLRLTLFRGHGPSATDCYVAQYKLTAAAPWSVLYRYTANIANTRIGLALKTSGAGIAQFTDAAMTSIPAMWTDLFDQDALDIRWNADVPSAAAGTVAFDAASNRVHFTSLASIDMWAARNNAPILWAPTPAGNFQFETHVAMTNTQAGAVAGLVVYGADGGLPDFTFGLDHWALANRMIKFQGLGDNNPLAYVTANGGEAWLRLTVYRGGGAAGVDRYVAQYKLTESAPWTALIAYDASLVNTRVGLCLKANGAGKTADYSYAAMAPVHALAAGDALKLDFSTAGDADGGSVADWNQVNTAGAALPAGRVERHGDGALVSGVSMAFTNLVAASFNNDSAAANWPGTAADPYYVLAADDIYFHGSTNTFGVTFGGLDAGLTYNVRIYSLISSGPTIEDRFVVTDGAGTRTVQSSRGVRWAAATLEAGGTVFAGVVPNANRELTVRLEAVGSVNYPLNAIVVEARPAVEGTVLIVQ